MDIRAYNRDAWNREVEGGENRWTQPVSPDVIARARQGEFSVLLTENIPLVPNVADMTRYEPLWNSPLAFILLIILLTVEWVGRKLLGLA